MKKIIFALITPIVLVITIIAGITVFLSKDDLSGCEATPDNSKSACKTADAIVAVSGGDTTARTTEAVRMYKNGWAKTLIFSGAAADKSGPSNASVMKKQAMADGVPESAIIIEEVSETTRENAEQVAKIFSENNISSAILVTSAYHSRRVAIEFAKATPGVNQRSHPVSTDKQWSSRWWMTPTGWSLAVQELVKIMGITAE